MKNRFPAWPLIALMIIPVSASAASLKRETVQAWDDYIQRVDASLHERTRAGGNFLWTFEDPERAAKVRNGELVVAPAPGQSPKKVPGGLIHHWIGAAFLPGTTIHHILAVTRDYDRYKDFYTPYVVDSKLVGRNGLEDRFTMQIMNKAFFVKNALDADYQTDLVMLDDHRVYSISRTTRMQEIEEYGHPDEHMIAEGKGGGYIWKLHSISRMEQRDGGVYIELEAVALSRDIPLAIRMFAEPIVRRVSRSSLMTSLEQTEKAVEGHSEAAAKSGTISAGAGHIGTSTALFSTKTSVIPNIQ